MLLKNFARPLAIALPLLSLAQCFKATTGFSSGAHLTAIFEIACPVVAPHDSMSTGLPTRADGCRMLKSRMDSLTTATLEACLWLGLSGVLTFIFGIMLLVKDRVSKSTR